METKFTKGEWEVDYETMSVVSKDEPIGDIICDAPEYAENSMRNWKANALLISKAPEMFEMLESILELQKENYGNGMATHLALFTKSKQIKQLLKEATEL